LLRVRALIDRPFDPYRKLRAPLVEVLGIALPGPEAWWGGFSQFTALDLHSWSTEGVQTRLAVGGILRLVSGPFTAELSAGPFVSLNELERRLNGNGDRFSRAGFLEQVSLAYQWGPLKLELLALVVQDWNGRWTGFYSSFERVSWRIFKSLSVGVTHQLLRSHVDEETGSFTPIGIFDGRKSRIAGFVQWQI
jgi:hypothetical protein